MDTPFIGCPVDGRTGRGAVLDRPVSRKPYETSDIPGGRDCLLGDWVKQAMEPAGETTGMGRRIMDSPHL